MEFAVFSIITKNCLSQCRTTINSFKKFYPGVNAYVLLLDSPNDYFAPERENFKIFIAEEIGLTSNRFEALMNEYSIFEICCISKAFFAKYLFEHIKEKMLFYLDTDLYFLSTIDKAIALLEKSNVVLTPHLLSKVVLQSKNEYLNEAAINGTGLFNMGFFGLQRSKVTFEFLEWWMLRILAFCKRDITKGLFDDQKWIDPVPFLFDKISVLTDPGYNVANWNLHERHLSLRNERYYVNANEPLVFFHFSRYRPDQSYKLTEYRTLGIEDFPNLAGLCNRYRDELMKNEWEKTHSWPFSLLMTVHKRKESSRQINSTLP